MSLKCWMVRTFKIGYKSVPLEDNISDTEDEICVVPNCCEDVYTKNGKIYNFCKNHYLMNKGSLDIYRVCDKPDCNVTVTTPNSKYCFEHS